MGVVLVPGTWAWNGLKTKGQWYQDGSPFVTFLEAQGIPVLSKTDPFIWNTEINGVLPIRKHQDWMAAGINLRQYLDPHVAWGVPLPTNERKLIVHSHGLQVALYAAYLGCEIDTLVSVCSPVREDMKEIWQGARKNIRRWWHIADKRGDKYQRLGSLFDGALGWSKFHPGADQSIYIPKIGHSGLLSTPSLFPKWNEVGIVEMLKE